MTPTEKDKELSEKLRVMIRGYLRNYTDIARDSSVYANEVLSLTTADRERVALEARIDELENRLRVQFIPSHWARLCAEVNSWAKYVDRRIAELKAQQEKL